MNLIDVRLVITQILGFLVLLWALRKWAWGPVLELLEKRRAAIQGQFTEAERRQAEADRLKAQYEADLRGIEQQARQRIQDAVAEGQKVAADIKAQAHADAQARLQRAEQEVAHERAQAREAIKQQIITLAMRSAEKILREKLDDAHQRRLNDEFIDEVGAAS
jgi:F-type H+-transporting ATPase subunit b